MKHLLASLVLLCACAVARADPNTVLWNGIVEYDSNFITDNVQNAGGGSNSLSRNITNPAYLDPNIGNGGLPNPILIAVGRQLPAVDEFFRRKDSNNGRTYYQALVSPKGPVYRNGTYGTWGYLDGVWWSPEEGKLFAYVQGDNRYTTKLLTATDPLSWTSEGNVIKENVGAVHGRDWATVYYDALTSDANQRWKRISLDSNGYNGLGLSLKYSADGRTWTEGPRGSSTLTGAAAEAASFGYDPFRGVWWIAPRVTDAIDYKFTIDPNMPVGYYRTGDTGLYPKNGSTYFRLIGTWAAGQTPSTDPNWASVTSGGSTTVGQYNQRLLRYREAPDVETLITRAWTAYHNAWFCADTLDVNLNTGAPGAYVVESYTLSKVAHESLWILFPGLYHGDGSGAPYEHRINTGIGFSRDGFHYTRPADRTPFIPWDADASEANAKKNYALPPGTMLTTATHHIFLFGGANNVPQAEYGAMMLATLPRGRFASADGNASGQVFITNPIRWPSDANYFFINADAAGGSITVEVCDPNGSSLKFLADANCIPCRANNLMHLVRWEAGACAPNIQNRQGSSVILKFYLKSAKLYEFWISPSPAGESRGYVNWWPQPR
jgi:hypothetical protein